jgi:hypothetical protein
MYAIILGDPSTPAARLMSKLKSSDVAMTADCTRQSLLLVSI